MGVKIASDIAVAVALAGAGGAAPLAGQTLQAPVMGRMTATEVGVEPMMRVSSADYVALARAHEVFEVAAARLARTRARAPATRVLAARFEATYARLLASRPGAAGPAAAALRMDYDRALRTLRDTPIDRVDALYLRQAADAHRHAWALHAGFAADGADAGLRARARADLIRTEQELRVLPTRPMLY